jgi:hypothetical protein
MQIGHHMINTARLQSRGDAETRARSLAPYLWHTLIFLGAFVLLSTRRPDALIHPQFYAEDGKSWYTDAYNLGGLKALFLSVGGYVQIYPRLIAALVQPLPLVWAPLVFNVVAIITRILPISFLLSSRFERVIPSKPARGFLALFLLALPG